MGLKVQICPVGFEYKRVLAGVKAHPANMVILLYSDITKDKYSDPEKEKLDSALQRVSEKFTDQLYDYFKKSYQTEVSKHEISFVRYIQLVEKFCVILREIFKLGSDENPLDEIWINIGTATKLVAVAAQYIASFRPDKIHLFYVRAHNYTINRLLDGKSNFEEIKETFEGEGVTYSNDGIEHAYTPEDLPVVPSQITSEKANKILANMPYNGKFEPSWVSFKDLVSGLESGFVAITDNKKIKSLKMKYHHHLNKLIQRQLIQVKRVGREREYILTTQGVIFAIIVSTLPLKY